MILLAGATTMAALPVQASADLEWSFVEGLMGEVCGGPTEAAAAAARKTQSCINIAETACEAEPKGPEQALYHTEGCEIVKENASRRSSTQTASSGGSDAGLIAGLSAAFVVLVASAGWVAVDSPKRDWSQARGPRRRFVQVLAVLLLWPLFFPLYLIERRKMPVAHAAT
jgi:hypothetical protein